MDGKGVSRRDFLKLAGSVGALAGMGAGLGSLLSACGETGGGTSTSESAGGSEQTSGQGTPTSVSTGAEQGKEIKVGVIVPMTGPLAEFGAPTDYIIPKVEEVTGGKIVTKDGKERKLIWIQNDSQSDSNRAAQVTGDLIQNDKVSLILAEGGPDSVLGPADQCEALGCPGLFCNLPWTAFVYGRGNDGKTPFQWTYAATVGTQENGRAALDAFNRFKPGHNKKVALLYPNNANGIEYSDMKTGIPPLLDEAGYSYVMPDLYPPGSEDFTAQISLFKKEGCELLMGSGVTPEFANFFNQAVQQGFTPPLMSNGIALLFPSAPAAIGPTATNLICECAFHPTLNYKSPLTGQTCQELADDYERVTGKQWTGILNALKLFEWAVDVFKRADNVEDPASIIEAVKTTKMETIQHSIDFTLPVGDKRRPHPNICIVPVFPGQWQKGKGKWPFDQVIVGDGGWSEFNPPIGGEVLQMTYGA